MSLAAALLLPGTLAAADPNELPTLTRKPGLFVEITGQATVVDGHTLWLPRPQILVKLAGIDSCALPQWSFDPNVSAAAPSPAPVACGALAKAWLTRLVGDTRISCVIDRDVGTKAVAGVCRAGALDLGREMLRVGWATLVADQSGRPDYRAAQAEAMDARHGLWGTYVLDFDEWRTHAVDRTLGRRPLADWNLLATREREISPAFTDARRQPAHRDR
jgi:endonuclease YncB( thermonuclease family)